MWIFAVNNTNVGITVKKCGDHIFEMHAWWIWIYGSATRQVTWYLAHEDSVTGVECTCPLNGEKNGTGSISPLVLFFVALLRADGGGFFAEPLLALNKHIAIREHLDNVAQEALRRQRIPPPESALAGLDSAAALEECEFGRGLHLAEHLPDGELLVEEESLDVRRADVDGAGRDAGRLPAA